MTTENTHGGSRPGAGRPKAKKPKAQNPGVTIRCEKKVREKFQRLCKAKGRTQEEVFSFWVKAAPDV